jgi:hypothetical protein
MIQKENKVMNTDKEMVDLPPFPAWNKLYSL